MWFTATQVANFLFPNVDKSWIMFWGVFVYILHDKLVKFIYPGYPNTKVKVQNDGRRGS